MRGLYFGLRSLSRRTANLHKAHAMIGRYSGLRSLSRSVSNLQEAQAMIGRYYTSLFGLFTIKSTTE